MVGQVALRLACLGLLEGQVSLVHVLVVLCVSETVVKCGVHGRLEKERRWPKRRSMDSAH